MRPTLYINNLHTWNFIPKNYLEHYIVRNEIIAIKVKLTFKPMIFLIKRITLGKAKGAKQNDTSTQILLRNSSTAHRAEIAAH